MLKFAIKVSVEYYHYGIKATLRGMNISSFGLFKFYDTKIKKAFRYSHIVLQLVSLKYYQNL